MQLTPCPGRRLHNCYYCITISLTFSPVLPSFLTSILSCCGTRIFGPPSNYFWNKVSSKPTKSELGVTEGAQGERWEKRAGF